MSTNKLLDPNNIPKHIAIIMDGNGRWAKQQGKNRVFGHRTGVTSVKSVVEGAAELGVKNLTLYAFSSENWNRPKLEINALMQLLVTSINNETKTLNKNNIRLMAIGELTNLPKNCYSTLMKAIKKTENNDRMNLILAISYSSRWELSSAIKNILKDVMANKFGVDDINEDLIQKYLTTADLPNPELLIRTSGEMRISNFLLWQIAYSELYFTKKNWPDFRKEDLIEAIIEYQQRERRFGLTSEQIIDNG